MRLDSIIDSFVASLPTMDSISRSTNKDLVRGLLVVHTFARIATIELDAGLQGLNPSRNDKDLSAARAVAFAVLCSNAKEMRHLDPILAVSELPHNLNRT